jgi:hypothetical protein
MADKLRIHEEGVWKQCWFHCPGCQNDHAFTVAGTRGPIWTWNGSMVSPTFTPSLMCDRDTPSRRCHTIVTDGKIAFQLDCHHTLAGQTVDMPDWEDW